MRHKKPRAQLSLAEAYARQGQVARSEAFLKHLLREPAQGDHVDAYLKALSKLQHRYPVVASASVALLPSTNSATLKLYDADFAAVDYARRDEIYRFGVSLSDSRIKLLGSTPKLSCGYKVQSSNIALYTSSTTDCRLGWSYRF